MSNGGPSIIDTLIDKAKRGEYNTPIDVPTPVQNAGDTGFSPLNKYDTGLIRGVHQGDVRASNQPNWKAMLGGIAQIGSTAVGDFVGGIGYLAKLKDITDIAEVTEKDFENWFVQAGEKIKEAGQEMAPVYASQEALGGFRPWDGEWWGANIPSIGSTLALMLPGAGIGGLVGKLASVTRLASAGSKANLAVRGMSAALASRHVESMMESKGVFDSVFQEAIQAGKSEAEANVIAGEAASGAYKLNYINLLTDIPQYMMLMGAKFDVKSLAGKPKETFKKSAAGYGATMSQEALEEAVQHIISAESERKGSLAITGKDDGTTFSDRLTKYIADPQLWTASFFGGMGGAGFHAIGKFFNKGADKYDDPSRAALYNLIADAVETGDFERHQAAIEDLSTQDPKELGVDATEFAKNMARAKEAIAEAQRAYESFEGDPAQKLKASLTTHGKLLEGEIKELDEHRIALQGKFQDPTAFNKAFLEQRLSDLEKRKEGLARDAELAQVRRALDADGLKEADGLTKAQRSTYRRDMQDLARKENDARINQIATALQLDILEKGDVEAQRQLAQEEAKRVAAKQRADEAARTQRVGQYKQDMAQAQSPADIESMLSSIPDEDIALAAQAAEEIKKAKAFEEARYAPSKLGYDFTTEEGIDQFLADKYDNRPFLEEQDLRKARVASREALKEILKGNMPAPSPQPQPQPQPQAQPPATPLDSHSSVKPDIAESSSLPIAQPSRNKEDINDFVDKDVIYKGKKAKVHKTEGGVITIETDTRIYEYDPERGIFSDEISFFEQGISKTYDAKITAKDEVVINGVAYRIIKNNLGNVEMLETAEGTFIKNERMLIAVEVALNKEDYKEASSVVNAIEDDNSIFDYNKILDFIFSDNMTDTVAEALDKLYAKKRLSDQEGLQTALWLEEASYRVIARYDQTKDAAEQEVLLNAYETLEIIRSLLYNLGNAKVKEKVSSSKTKASKSAKTKKGKTTEQVEAEIIERYKPRKEKTRITKKEADEAINQNSKQAETQGSGTDNSSIVEQVDEIWKGLTEKEKREVRKKSNDIHKMPPSKLRRENPVALLEILDDYSEPIQTDTLDENTIEVPEDVSQQQAPQGQTEQGSEEAQPPQEQTGEEATGPSLDEVEPTPPRPGIQELAMSPEYVTFMEELEKEAIEDEAANFEEPEAQEIVGYEEGSLNIESVDNIENDLDPAFIMLNDMAHYKYDKDGNIQIQGKGKYGQRHAPDSPFILGNFKVPYTEHWMPLKDKTGAVVESDWRKDKIDLDFLRNLAQNVPDWYGRRVMFEIDPADIYQNTAGAILIYPFIELEGGQRKYLGVLKSSTLVKNHPDAGKLNKLRKQIFDAWAAADQSKVFVPSVSSTLNDIRPGRFWEIPVNKQLPNGPTQTSQGELSLAVGISVGSTVHIDTNGKEVPIARATSPRAGAVYQYVPGANGRGYWARVFTKKLHDESAKAHPGMFPTWERYASRASIAKYGSVENVPLRQVVLDLLGLTSNPELWAKEWSNIRAELQSIVRFTKTDKDGKKHYYPDFRANLPAIFANKGYTPQSFFDFLELGDKTIQIDSKQINDGNYNRAINSRLISKLNPGSNSHSPTVGFDLSNIQTSVRPIQEETQQAPAQEAQIERKWTPVIQKSSFKNNILGGVLGTPKGRQEIIDPGVSGIIFNSKESVLTGRELDLQNTIISFKQPYSKDTSLIKVHKKVDPGTGKIITTITLFTPSYEKDGSRGGGYGASFYSFTNNTLPSSYKQLKKVLTALKSSVETLNIEGVEFNSTKIEGSIDTSLEVETSSFEDSSIRQLKESILYQPVNNTDNLLDAIANALIASDDTIYISPSPNDIKLGWEFPLKGTIVGETQPPSKTLSVKGSIESTQQASTQETQVEEKPEPKIGGDFSGVERTRKRFRKKTGAELPIWDRETEVAKFKKMFPNVPIHVLDTAMSIGKDYWGLFEDNAVAILEGAPQGTAYHEAFHVAYWLSTDASQRAAIEAEARKRFGLKGFSSEQVEEFLADRFMEYVLSKESSAKSLGSAITRFFRKLLELMKMALGYRGGIDSFFFRAEAGMLKVKPQGVKAPARFKLIEAFPNLYEQKRRVENAMSLLDDLVYDVSEARKTTVEAAYLQVAQKLRESVLGQGLRNLSVLERFKEQEAHLEEKGLLTVRRKAEFRRVYEALGTYEKPGKLIHLMAHQMDVRGVSVDIGISDDVFVNQEEASTTEAWQIKAKISPMQGASQKLKRWLSYVPKMDKQGVEIRDNLGFVIYHPSNLLFVDLLEKIGYSSSPEHMMDKLSKLTHPHYVNYVYPAVADNPALRAELWQHIGQLMHPEFHDVIREVKSEYGMITSDKYSLKSSGTDNVVNDLLDDLFSGFIDPSANKYINAERELIYADRLKAAITKWYNSPTTAASMHDIALSVGIHLDIDYLEAAEATGKLQPLKTALKSALDNFSNGDVTFDNRYIKDFVKELASHYPHQYQTSFLNVEGEIQYEWLVPNFLAKTVARLKSKLFPWDNYKKDPFYKYLLDNGVIDKGKWEKVRWTIVGGIKHEEGKGDLYSNFGMSDMLLSMMSLFKEGWYVTSILSDSPALTALKLGKEANTNAILNKLVSLAQAEYVRNVNNSKHKGYFGKYTPESFLLIPTSSIPNSTDIEEIMNMRIARLKAKLVDMRMINNSGKLNFDTSIDTEIFLSEFVYNYALKEAEILLMLQGDPAFYKSVEDFFKRAKEVWSPGKYLDTDAEFVTEEGKVIRVSKAYNLKIFKDELVSPSYDEVTKARAALGMPEEEAFKKSNESDAQSYIDLYSYRARMIGMNRWTNDMQKAYDILITGKHLYSKDLNLPKGVKRTSLEPIKPFYFAHHLLKEVLMYPFQNKDSEVLLLPSMANGNPLLEAMLFEMGYSKLADGSWQLDEAGREALKYVDKHTSQEAVKIPLGDESTGGPIGNTPESGDMIQLSYDDWRMQLETPAHYFDSDGTFGTQIMKLIPANIQDDTIIGDRTAKEVKDEYEQLLIDDINRSHDALMAKFYRPDGSFDKEGAVKLIRKEVKRRKLSSQYEEALEQDLAQLDSFETKLPLTHPLNSNRVEAMISSLFRKYVTNRKFSTGVSLYNVSARGLERKPEIVFKEDGTIDYIEAYAPPYSSYIINTYMLPDGTIDWEAINRLEPELLDGIVYRIPTEDKYSMYKIRIIGFTDLASGGQIILPPEAVTISGLDFDIDKMFGFFKTKENPYAKALEKLDAIIKKDFDENIAFSDQVVDDLWQSIFSQFDNESDYSLEEIGEVLKDNGKSLQAYQELEAKKLAFDAQMQSDNRKLDLMMSMLQTPEATRSFLTPGGFENYRAIANQVIAAQGIRRELDLTDPLHIAMVANRMNTGKAMVGIAANANAARARWQGHELTLLEPFVFDEIEFSNLSSIDPQVARDIAEILAASVDNGKDPLAEFVNLNTETADVVIALLATGVGLERALKFVAQPGIRRYIEEKINTGKGVRPRKSIESYDSVSIDDLNEGLSENAGSIRQQRMLATFLHFQGPASDVSELIKITKVADAGPGPKLTESLDKIAQYESFPVMISGVEDFVKQGFHAAFVDKGIRSSLRVFNDLGFPSFESNAALGRILSDIDDMAARNLNRVEKEFIFRNFLDFLSSDFEFFSIENLVNAFTKVPELVAVIKQHPSLSNLFLDRLNLKDGVVTFKGVIGIDNIEEDYIRSAWQEMAGDSTEIPGTGVSLADLSKLLMQYSFGRSGFRTAGKAGFSHLMPIGEMIALRDSNGKSFNKHIKDKIEEQNEPGEGYDYVTFIDQFVRNYPDKLAWLARAKNKNIIWDKETRRPISIKENTYFNRYISADGVLMKRSADGVYYPVSSLGVSVGKTKVLTLYSPFPLEMEEDVEAFDKAMAAVSDLGTSAVEGSLVKDEATEEGEPGEQIPMKHISINGATLPLWTYKGNNKVSIELTDDQAAGLQKIADWVDANIGKANVSPFVLSGKAGTGKTTLIRMVTQYIQTKYPSNSSMVILTTSHKAGRVASKVTFGVSGKYKTLASAFGNKYKKIESKVVLFDEVSMNEDYYYKKTVELISKSAILPIFIGDVKQLPPIDGNQTSLFFESPNKHQLNEIVRFQNQGPIFKVADAFAENLKSFNPLASFPASLSDSKESVTSLSDINDFIDSFLNTIVGSPDMSQTRLITYSNKSIREYTSTIRNKIFKKESLKPDFNITPQKGEPMMGDAAWSTRQPLTNPVLNSVDYLVQESGEAVDTIFRSPDGEIPVKGVSIELKESTPGMDNSWGPTILVTTQKHSPDMALYVASLMHEMASLPRDERFLSDANGILEAIEKAGIYFVEPIHAKLEKGNFILTESAETATITVKPNIAFGYALTAHKAQGSTYENVFVDETNMSLYAGKRQVFNRKKEFFSWEQNNMKYVGFSRASKNLVILTDKDISEGETITVNPNSTPNDIAPQLTSQPSIKVTVDTSASWSALKTQPVYTEQGVNTMRTSNKEAEYAHFGNPFSESGYSGTIKMPTVQDAINEYKAWLEGQYGDRIAKEQRGWILDQIDSGKLDNATLLYDKSLAARGLGTHANALKEVIEARRSTRAGTKGSSQPSRQQEQDYKNYINYSGAAAGSDTAWASIGKEYGLGKQVDFTPDSLARLTPTQLDEVEQAYLKAVEQLGRIPLSFDTYAGKLVRRDYLQAKSSDAVFAISSIIYPGQKNKKGYVHKGTTPVVDGGTGYAVQMAINLGKPVYVFDQNQSKWFTWNSSTFTEIDTPTLTKKFSGIGTREINKVGKQAIRDVYEKGIEPSRQDIQDATGEVMETETLWLNYRQQMLAKNPNLTFAEFKSTVEKKGVEFITEYLKNCYK